MNISSPSLRYGAQPVKRRSTHLTGVAVAVALHAIAIVILLQFESVRSALTEVAPVMVRMITPAAKKPDEPPKPLPVKPKVQPKPVVPQPVVTAPVEAPTPYTAPPTPPAPVVETPVAPPAPPAPAAVAAPAPVIPPNFNASYLQNPPPPYPSQARRMGQQGKVILRVRVNTAGLADQVEVRTGSGYGALDQAALDTVKRWRFVPARQGDQPVAAWVLVPITFTLEG